MDDPVAVVRAMCEADNDGRRDDLAAMMHPEVVGRPTARPGLSRYQGPEGIRRMRGDAYSALGALAIVIDDVSALADGAVLTRGHTDSLAGQNPFAFRVVCEVRDGLITRIESLTGNDSHPI